MIEGRETGSLSGDDCNGCKTAFPLHAIGLSTPDHPPRISILDREHGPAQWRHTKRRDTNANVGEFVLIPLQQYLSPEKEKGPAV
ncbi:hypothetical protein PSAC2689_40424 [Paraburkholderia sacchari]